MNVKLTSGHLARGAIVFVRQSTPGPVIEHTESRRRQYALQESARSLGFAPVAVIDDDLGRSGSGLTERPGFQKLVAAVCAGTTGAVFCIEASRLARNGRDWHHLIDLCALTGTLVIDPDGMYDPRLVNDRLLLGLKGTMSEYELSLLRQRGIVARDARARRGELRFALPPGYCRDELGRPEIDPDERIADTIRLVLRKFRELASARQVLLCGCIRRQYRFRSCDRRPWEAESSGRAHSTSRCWRCCATRSMLAPTCSAEPASEPTSSKAVRARPTVTPDRCRRGAS